MMKEFKFLTRCDMVVPKGEQVNVSDGLRKADDIVRNVKWKVIETCLTLEQEMTDILASYFFDPGDPKKEPFQRFILESDSFTFASNLKLLLNIIEKEEYLTGTDREALGQRVRYAMTYRNMFTHGTTFIHDGIPGLKYFQNKPKKELLTDEFLTKMETTLFEAFKACV